MLEHEREHEAVAGFGHVGAPCKHFPAPAARTGVRVAGDLFENLRVDFVGYALLEAQMSRQRKRVKKILREELQHKITLTPADARN